ncbi:helix-turn-helix domain-containing protein [Lacimicrobium sp. SS2-24]|uniref:GlxA family transcriptional regulator n=1 Tax=Lacimicrobium sp. SS2-24 TaxID=2005569 RepID=UPI000B4BBA61|nr:helix-turn-helix domain-containing protein [Lacimicrobium sp. SS2-24]
MKKIAILATDNALGSELMGVKDFVAFANSYQSFLHPGTEPLFTSDIYSSDGRVITCSNGLSVPSLNISKLEQVDALIAVAAYAYNKESLFTYLNQSQAMVPIMQEAVNSGKRLASHCVGTFALAEAGILDGRQATTCWWMKEVFARRYPKVEMIMDRLVVQSDNVTTAGATTAFSNMLMALVEDMSDAQFASGLSKVLLLDRQRLSQQPFINPALVIGHRDSVITNIQLWMRRHYTEAVSLDQLCDQFALTKRTLIRRFKAATGQTPLVYLQQLRVEKAKSLLEATDQSVERIVEQVGYDDPASFRRLFVNHTQLTPKVYRQRFGLNPTAS